MEQEKMFSKQCLLLIPLGLAVNYLGSQLAILFELPLFLDCVGTIIAGALGGLLPGILVGFFSNVLISLADPISLYYAILNVLIGILAALFSSEGWLRRLRTSLASALAFALVGGGIGSLLTWALYGLNLGEGISATLTARLAERGLGRFAAQLSADVIIDLLDKLVVLALVWLLLRYFPRKVLEHLPLGHVYLHDREEQFHPSPWWRLFHLRDEGEREPLRFSLQNKVVFLIISTSVILSILAISISFLIYRNTTDERYTVLCRGAAQLIAEEVGERAEDFLAQGYDHPDYALTEQRLSAIRDSFSGVEYAYVYQIQEDGCHVIFDVDTPEVPGNEPGDVVPFDETFYDLLPDLLAGRDIAPIISNDQYGWLLSVYLPIRDASGRCLAYAAADVAMSDVISDRYMFLIRMLSLLLGASIIIVTFSVWFAQRQLVRPINRLAEAAGHFAYDRDHQSQAVIEQVQQLEIHTGDEIENLGQALARLVRDVDRYIGELNEKNADLEAQSRLIARIQENVILSFANMIENRDQMTGSHVRHTAGYVRAIGQALAEDPDYAAEMAADDLDNLTKSAPLHDIGKIKVPDAILNKPGRLTPEEFEIIKTHTTAGGAILQEAMAGLEGDSFLNEAVDLATYHHERWDGTGYPQGLAGREIPLSARIMAVADVFDALISRRSYKEAYPFEKAVDIIREQSGKQFDPGVVAAFLASLSELRRLSQE